MLNCVIVDDEQFSIDAITKYIAIVPKLKILAIYTDPQEALEFISMENKIDILFMDIDMPNLSGLELARTLRFKTRKLIFTTAHSKYAFEAFDAEGDAYLLKPFTFSKFATTINRLFPNDAVELQEEVNVTPNKEESYFLVKNKEEDLRIIKVMYNDVIAFESSSNYIKIYLTSNKILTAYLTIKDVLELLGTREGFHQFHRAFVISTMYINYIDGNTIKMTNNLTFTVGESYRMSFGNYLSSKLFKTLRKK